MAHNLYFDKRSQKYAFAGVIPAWHNLGQIVGHAMTWEEAMREALLDWEVEKIQLSSPINGELIPLWGVFRKDNHSFLGGVKDQYTTIQNNYQFEFVDTLLEADESAHYVAAGALGNGERIWCLARINGDIRIKGTDDKHETYLLFESSHDGSRAATCKLTTVRVVCQNTLSIALAHNGMASLKVRHTRSAESKLEHAKKLMTGITAQIKDVERKLNELAQKMVTKESYKEIMKRLFGDWEEKEKEGKSTARIENKIAEITQLFDYNDKNEFPQIRGTGYNLLNAITEYTDHVQDYRQTQSKDGMEYKSIRAEGAMFGSGSKLKEQALEVIYDVVMKDGTITKMPMSEYHKKMNGSLVDWIADSNA